ncbi:response regulator [Joostella sp. CR20]|uniref:response regulator n=1 Tax=Joostella sp. CR20 TaxID=2804312 RepID=UPI00313BE025
MFKKILIAEDIDSINIGLVNTLKEAYNVEIDHAKYCDDAYLKIKSAIQKNTPYDLLITDLSFKQDHRKCNIASGDKLAGKVKLEQPNIAVIIYSIEDRPHVIKSFFDNIGINGYVCKGRNSAKEMVTAVKQVYNTNTYIPEHLKFGLRETRNIEIENYDVLLLEALSQGNSQNEIKTKFKSEGVSPCSLSTIEKRINNLRNTFKAKNTTHLISIAKDLGVI